MKDSHPALGNLVVWGVENFILVLGSVQQLIGVEHHGLWLEDPGHFDGHVVNPGLTVDLGVVAKNRVHKVFVHAVDILDLEVVNQELAFLLIFRVVLENKHSNLN